MEGFKNLRDSKEGMLEEINELTNQLVQWTENQNNAGNARKILSADFCLQKPAPAT
jgi:hypothetical protein